MPVEHRPSAQSILDDLGRRSLLIVSGKGGVGRTTVAALLGQSLAREGRRVLVCTTGHDDRLAWMLGARRLDNVAREVAPRLCIQRLVPRLLVREYGALILRSERLSRRVFGNRVVSRLLEAIPGFEDFAILGKAWHEATRADDHDVVVFDGPASGHLRLVLGVPDTLVESAPDGPLRREAVAMAAALRNPEVTTTVLVSLAEHWPLTELSELALELHRDLGMQLGALVVNKMWPHRIDPIPAAATREPEVDDVLDQISQMAARAQQRREVIESWRASAAAELLAPVSLSVPWWPESFDGTGALERLRERVRLISAQEGGA